MSTLRLDPLYSHSKNLGAEQVGEFCGSPIVTMNQRAIDVDNLAEVQRMIEVNKGLTQSETSALLPGEVVCPDGVIRRSTAAETVGEDFYKFSIPENTRKVNINLAKQASLAGELITWRPNGVSTDGEEFALVHYEG